MPADFLVFRAGDRACALALDAVREVLRPPALEHVHGAPRFILGASIIRGRAVPIVDSGVLLGRAPLDDVGRVIALELGPEHHAGLAVSDVIGVYPAAALHLEEAPPLLVDADKGVVTALGRKDGALLSVLMLARVVPDTVWASLQQPAT